MDSWCCTRQSSGEVEFIHKHADSAQPIPIVHDAKRFEVDRLLDVAFNPNGNGLLFKVRWAAAFNGPSEDTWEPMRGVDHLNIFSKFLRTDVYREFSATPSLLCQISQHLACKSPQDTKIMSAAQRGRWCLTRGECHILAHLYKC
jgi:hypothetical protein